MASQRLTVAKLAGAAGQVVSALFKRWIAAGGQGETPTAAIRQEVDQFGEQLRANGAALPVLYFCEWIDRWSMGDTVSQGAVRGNRFEVSSRPRSEVIVGELWAGADYDQEGRWFFERLQEAAAAWEPLVSEGILVVLREVFGGMSTDEEVPESLPQIPGWLAALSRDE